MEREKRIVWPRAVLAKAKGMSKMGRGAPQKQVDLSVLEDMLMDQRPRKEIAKELCVHPITLGKIIKRAKDNKTILSEYRTLRNLHLTEIQVAVLQAITPDKIENADVKTLMYAYKILREKEIEDDGRDKEELKGLVAHLLHLERLERELGRTLSPDDIQDAEFEEAGGEEGKGGMNNAPEPGLDVMALPQLPDPTGD